MWNMFKVKNKDKHQNNVNDFNFVNSVNLEYILYPFLVFLLSNLNRSVFDGETMKSNIQTIYDRQCTHVTYHL